MGSNIDNFSKNDREFGKAHGKGKIIIDWNNYGMSPLLSCKSWCHPCLGARVTWRLTFLYIFTLILFYSKIKYDTIICQYMLGYIQAQVKM